MGYKAKAKLLGTEFVHDEVVQITTENCKVTGVKLSSGGNLKARFVVNCAGAWAAKVAQTAGIKIPVEPIKRQVYALDTKVKPNESLPVTICPSNLSFLTEIGGLILCYKAFPDDPVGFDFSWEKERFIDILWPELAEIVPAWDTLKLVRGWAGLYAVNRLDNNAILGEWPELKGLILANGFSGHGLQQAPAVARYISELIIGREPTLDLSIFGPERILKNRPLTENRIV
jgi:glycine/D-amino acid oxidase-like deaminating enzyme